jgi:RNA-binding protein
LTHYIQGSRPISDLTSKARAHLRKLAHDLKPILQIGADGVSTPFLESLEEAFNTRELLKVKVLDTADVDRKEAATAIQEAGLGMEVVQVIGRTLVIYRPHPEDPEIELPQ